MIQNNSMRNGNIISKHPDEPDHRDLEELQRWFALQGMYADFLASPPEE
jgi:hypothetical protein